MSESGAKTTESRRVVITGLGTVTALGRSAEALWESCVACKSGVTEITRFDTTGYTTRIAGEIKDWSVDPYMDKKEARRTDRFIQYAVVASLDAVKDSGLVIDDSNRARVGVVIGSGIGGLETLEEQSKLLLDRGPSRISPFLIPSIICDMGAGQVSIMLGAQGPNSCVTTACATGANSIGDAYMIIKRGEADAMIAGGTEASITQLSVAGFSQARSLSQRNDDPETASRPFDANRDGFVMSEGAGIVVLEALESAQARGAHIYAEIIGYGMAGDAYHMTAPAPGGAGAARAMRAALKSAGLSPTDVEYINTHGTSTEIGDKCETAAIKSVFEEHAFTMPVSSTKSMTGHLVGAAGAVECILTSLMLERSLLLPTINYETPDPDCDLDYVPNEPRPANIEVAVSNSFGFGGHNVSLVLRKAP